MPALLNTVYCPRCDRAFTSPLSRVYAMGLLNRHIRKAHPEFIPLWFD